MGGLTVKIFEAALQGNSCPVEFAEKYGLEKAYVAQEVFRFKKVRGIYRLRCPVTKVVRYVGSSNDIGRRNRDWDAILKNRFGQTRWYDWRQFVEDAGAGEPEVEVLEVVLGVDKSELLKAEQDWIKIHKHDGLADLNVVVRPAGARKKV